eukprot:TRINITY_DN22633_c0_g1_i1.p1 TRINITY_DN22633_c0_g1~~TRINITY_DN22633_c0_g1_i1.p1  ORF type:complete len:813 (+),score=171.60 TRINITY_DN22633_c0_g1_i1:122-2560(+)
MHGDVVDWAVTVVGGVVYCLTVPACVIVWRLNRAPAEDEPQPGRAVWHLAVSTRYPGLSTAALAGGALWFLGQIAEQQLRLQEDTLSSTLDCWAVSFVMHLGVGLWTSSLLAKQHRQYRRYVVVEGAPHPGWVVAALVLPFLALLSVPAKGDVRDNCNRHSVMWRVLAAYVGAQCIPFAVLLRSLSDPSCYFPNYGICWAEFATMATAASTLIAMSFTDRTSYADVMIASHTLLGTVLSPVGAFGAAVGEPLFRWWRNDIEYLRVLHRRLQVNAPLFSSDERGEQGGGASPPGSPIFFSGADGVFEVERLAQFVEAGDPDQVKRWLLRTNISAVNALDKEGLTPLHRAVRACNRAVSELLLDFEANPDAAAADGSSPVHIAARRGSCDLIYLLHECGANVNAATPSGVTPLHAAIEYRQMGAISTLLRLGGDARAAGVEGELHPDSEWDIWSWEDVHVGDRGWMRAHRKSPFVLACELGYREIVSVLLETTELLDSGAADAPCAHGITPLQLCAALGHVHLVQYLLQLGEPRVDISRVNRRDGRNVFHYAAITGQADTLGEVLAYWQERLSPPPAHHRRSRVLSGGRRERRRPTAPAALHPQQQGGLQSASLLSPGDAQSGAGLSSATQSCDSLQQSCDEVPDEAALHARQVLAAALNARDCLGRTPLLYAVLGGHVQVARDLIREGVDVSTRDTAGAGRTRAPTVSPSPSGGDTRRGGSASPSQGPSASPARRTPPMTASASPTSGTPTGSPADAGAVGVRTPCLGLCPAEYAHSRGDVQMLKLFRDAHGCGFSGQAFDALDAHGRRCLVA